VRKEALVALLAYNAPLDQLVCALKQFPWDSEQELVTLKPVHIRAVLLRYLAQEITAQQVEDWANAIEGREDIAFEEAFESILGECIHQLANPLLTKPLTKDLAEELLRLLG
jgi:hypothetical protein